MTRIRKLHKLSLAKRSSTKFQILQTINQSRRFLTRKRILRKKLRLRLSHQLSHHHQLIKMMMSLFSNQNLLKMRQIAILSPLAILITSLLVQMGNLFHSKDQNNLVNSLHLSRFQLNKIHNSNINNHLIINKAQQFHHQ